MTLRLRVCAAALASVLAVPAAMSGTQAYAGSSSRVQQSRFARVESSSEVVNVLYRYGQNTPAPNGAYGPNVTAPRNAWYIEYQRAGAPDIIDGIVRPDQDPSLIAMGLKMFRFGLRREASNGRFPGSFWPFHSTAMFLSEAGPALIMLRQSQFEKQFASEIDWQVARMRKAAYAMVRYVGGPGRLDDYTKNHRWFEAAIALGSVGKLTHDPTLVRWSALYAWKGIAMGRPDGIMPEDGGHDSGYQALGMVNASRYLGLIATGHLFAALYADLSRGENWLLSRTESDGSVIQSGDTRSVDCQERNPEGECKTTMYAPIYSALAHWGAITGQARFVRAAKKVWFHAGYWHSH